MEFKDLPEEYKNIDWNTRKEFKLELTANEMRLLLDSVGLATQFLEKRVERAETPERRAELLEAALKPRRALFALMADKGSHANRICVANPEIMGQAPVRTHEQHEHFVKVEAPEIMDEIIAKINGASEDGGE